jgi:two-component system, sensor histidine kinase YesM
MAQRGLRERAAGIVNGLSIGNKIFLSLLGVLLVAIAFMCAAAFYSLNVYKERADSSVVKNQLAQAGDDVAYKLALCARLSDILFNDLTIYRPLVRFYDGDLAVWEAYTTGGLLDRLRQYKGSNPEIEELTMYILNPSLIRAGNLLIPVKGVGEIPGYEAAAAAHSSPVFRIEDYSLANPGDAMPAGNVLVLERQLYNLSGEQIELKPIGMLRLELNSSRLFSAVSRGLGSAGNMWVQDGDGRVLAGKAPQAAMTKRGPVISLPIQATSWVLEAWVPARRPFDGLKDSAPLLLIVALLSVLALAVASRVVAQGFARRLHRLVLQAREVESGNLAARVGDGTGDEIGELARRLDRMTSELETLIRENYERKLKQKEAELTALQAQINPHLLYNTLSTVYWMATDIEADEIARAVDSLIRFFRYSLNKGSGVIALIDELSQAKAYLEIQQYRFKESKFSYDIEVDETLLGHAMPKLILQPFIENAILHGFDGLPYPGRIRVSVRRFCDVMRFEVEDNGVGMPEATIERLQDGPIEAKPAGYGIGNVRERLRLRYGSRAAIRLSRIPGGGTLVGIDIPLEEDGEGGPDAPPHVISTIFGTGLGS